MDGLNFTGFDNSYGHAVGRGNPGDDMNNANHNISFAQQSTTNEAVLSPALHCRHDSMTSPSPSHFSGYSVGQHQAEAQPGADAAQSTPHINRKLSYQAHPMVHGPSQLSNQSCLSFGGGHQPYTSNDPFQDVFTTGGADMSRSASDPNVVHSQSFNFNHSGHQSHNSFFRSPASHPTNPIPISFPVTPQYSPSIGHIDNSNVGYDWSSLVGLGAFGSNVEGIGQTSTEHLQISASLAPPNYQRPRAVSFGHPPLSNSFSLSPGPKAKRERSSAASSISPSEESLEPSPPPKKRRGHRSSLSDTEPEVVTGHVLASGQFQCAKLECVDLRFGRQADFRRHHTNVHAKSKTEYFCTFVGCDRSRRPSKKGKGRSFGNRRDKMEEHVRTVHEKENNKRKRAFDSEPEPDNDDEGDDDEYIEDAEQPRVKVQRL